MTDKANQRPQVSYQDVTFTPLGHRLRAVMATLYNGGDKDYPGRGEPMGYDRAVTIIEFLSYGKSGDSCFAGAMEGSPLKSLANFWYHGGWGVYKVQTPWRGDWAYDPDTQEIWPWGKTGQRPSHRSSKKIIPVRQKVWGEADQPPQAVIFPQGIFDLQGRPTGFKGEPLS